MFICNTLIIITDNNLKYFSWPWTHQKELETFHTSIYCLPVTSDLPVPHSSSTPVTSDLAVPHSSSTHLRRRLMLIPRGILSTRLPANCRTGITVTKRRKSPQEVPSTDASNRSISPIRSTSWGNTLGDTEEKSPKSSSANGQCGISVVMERNCTNATRWKK